LANINLINDDDLYLLKCDIGFRKKKCSYTKSPQFGFQAIDTKLNLKIPHTSIVNSKVNFKAVELTCQYPCYCYHTPIKHLLKMKPLNIVKKKRKQKKKRPNTNVKHLSLTTAWR
jgi:hypothetical protein